MATADILERPTVSGRISSRIDALNGRYHKIALRLFLAIVVAHWAEHLVQAVQIWLLNMPRPEARGVLGYWFPWLVKSEALHYGYAIVMLIGLMLLRPGFTGKARAWWNASLAIQLWHHVEHALLLGQVVVGANLFGQAKPTSVAQLAVMRVELHLLYNAAVFIPMVVAMVLHIWFPEDEPKGGIACTCSASHSHRRKHLAAAGAAAAL